MNNQRQHMRSPIKLTLLIRHPVLGELHLKTRDVSDGGVFLIDRDHRLGELGRVIEGQVQGAGDGSAPWVKMEVVRMEDSGTGLRFVTE